MAKLFYLCFLILALILYSNGVAPRHVASEATSPSSMVQPRQVLTDANESGEECQGEEVRKLMVDHTDYIYTQGVHEVP
ncbi:hypothetical protein ACHQM5_006800 [Ranunculus cassubicifolius]